MNAWYMPGTEKGSIINPTYKGGNRHRLPVQGPKGMELSFASKQSDSGALASNLYAIFLFQPLIILSNYPRYKKIEGGPSLLCYHRVISF